MILVDFCTKVRNILAKPFPRFVDNILYLFLVARAKVIWKVSLQMGELRIKESC